MKLRGWTLRLHLPFLESASKIHTHFLQMCHEGEFQEPELRLGYQALLYAPLDLSFLPGSLSPPSILLRTKFPLSSLDVTFPYKLAPLATSSQGCVGSLGTSSQGTWGYCKVTVTVTDISKFGGSNVFQVPPITGIWLMTPSQGLEI